MCVLVSPGCLCLPRLLSWCTLVATGESAALGSVGTWLITLPNARCSWPEVVLWVASSDADADVFVYLEDYDPVADVARYVTEGHFRASHRREHAAPPPGDPRAASHIPGRHATRNAVLRRLSLLSQ